MTIMSPCWPLLPWPHTLHLLERLNVVCSLWSSLRMLSLSQRSNTSRQESRRHLSIQGFNQRFRLTHGKKFFMFSETWLQRVFCYFYSWENIFRNVVFITLPEEALICRCCILSPAPAFPLPDALILLFHTHWHASEPSVAGVRVCVCPSAGLACLADSSNLFQDGAHIPTNTLWQPCQHNSAHSFCNKRCQTGFS